MTRLKHERQGRRLSQAQLGRDANIPQPMISQIERGVLVPSSEQLERLSKVLGVPSAELLMNVEVGAIRRFLQRLT